MTRRSSLLSIGGSLALVMLAAPAVFAASDQPPVITLGNLDSIYLQIRPWIAMAFVAMGLVAAVSRLWSVLGTVGGTSLLGSGGGSGGHATIGAIVTTILLIVGVVAAAILLLFSWLDVINGTVGILWSVMDGSVAPPTIPGLDPAPAASLTASFVP